MCASFAEFGAQEGLFHVSSPADIVTGECGKHLCQIVTHDSVDVIPTAHITTAEHDETTLMWLLDQRQLQALKLCQKSRLRNTQ